MTCDLILSHTLGHTCVAISKSLHLHMNEAPCEMCRTCEWANELFMHVFIEA